MSAQTCSRLTKEAMQLFAKRNRDLIALIRDLTVDQLFAKLGAAMQLHPEYTHGVLLQADIVDQPHPYARGVAREEFSKEIYRALCLSFLRIQRNFVIPFATKLTPEALTQLEQIEVVAGEREPVAPPPPPPSAQELLEAEVIADYNGAIGADKMRAKMNSNVAYRNTFNRLSESGQLESRVTALIDCGRDLR